MVLCIRLSLLSLASCIKVYWSCIKVCGSSIHVSNTVGILSLHLVGLVLPGCYYFLGQIDAAKPGVPLCCRVSNQTALRAYARWLVSPLGLSRELRQMPPALTRACICADPLGLSGLEPCPYAYTRVTRGYMDAGARGYTGVTRALGVGGLPPHNQAGFWSGIPEAQAIKPMPQVFLTSGSPP